MRKIIVAAVVGALGFAAGFGMLSRLLNQSQAEFAARQVAWQTEKANLEVALERERNRAPERSLVTVPPQILQVTNRLSAAEILTRLQTIRVPANSVRAQRQVIHELETLLELGPEALPAIREFLAGNVDVAYEVVARRSLRDGRFPTEFVVPPTLRIGLMEVAKNIGGESGEEILAQVLTNTRRGDELAYSVYALQELAPNKYRDAALTAARSLLASHSGSTTPQGRLERDVLYGLLSYFNDPSFVATAQAQVVQETGQIDKVSLRYLQKALGEQSVAFVSQVWQDPRLATDEKEPLARVALAYAGLNPQADQLYQTAINDPAMPSDERRNLIEDLNETGFADPKHLTPADLALIQKRIGMIEQLAPNSMDDINAAAFKEAYKDLVNMKNSLTEKPGLTK